MTPTFSELASLWKADKRQYIKPSSYAAYVHLLNRHLIPAFGTRNSISSQDIQDFVNTQLKLGLSAKFIKEMLMILKMILRYGAQSGAWKPIDSHIHFPTTAERQKVVQTLSGAEQSRLVHYLMEDLSCRNVGLMICLHCGLRIGEVCGLQWKDLDLQTGEIHVRKTVYRIYLSDGEEKQYLLSVGAPKTPTSVRDIPITRSLMSVIRPLKKRANPEYYVLSNDNRPLEPRYYRDYFRTVLSRLDISPVRFHALRHSFATRCIESKCDYKTVSVILGHSSISTTMDQYVHPGYAEKKRCLDRMARLLNR